MSGLFGHIYFFSLKVYLFCFSFQNHPLYVYSYSLSTYTALHREKKIMDLRGTNQGYRGRSVREHTALLRHKPAGLRHSNTGYENEIKYITVSYVSLAGYYEDHNSNKY